LRYCKILKALWLLSLVSWQKNCFPIRKTIILEAMWAFSLISRKEIS
jgi:hypothetical protein